MQTELIGEAASQTYVAILETGEDVLDCLTTFARNHGLEAAHFTAIGAFSDVMLGYFDWSAKVYRNIPVLEQVEVLSLVGDIALDASGEPTIHAHVVVGREDGTVRGGHLLAAHVRPTLEVMLTEAPKSLSRRYDPTSGLALIDVKHDTRPLL